MTQPVVAVTAMRYRRSFPGSQAEPASQGGWQDSEGFICDSYLIGFPSDGGYHVSEYCTLEPLDDQLTVTDGWILIVLDPFNYFYQSRTSIVTFRLD